MEKSSSLVKGDEVDTITTFEKLKTPLLNMKRGYPLYWYWGIIEHYFEEDLGNKVVDMLTCDGIIETIIDKKTNKRLYRLTEKGIQITSSLLTRKKIDVFKWIVVVLGTGTLFYTFMQCIISLWF